MVIHYEEALYQVYAPFPLPMHLTVTFLRVEYQPRDWFPERSIRHAVYGYTGKSTTIKMISVRRRYDDPEVGRHNSTVNQVALTELRLGRAGSRDSHQTMMTSAVDVHYSCERAVSVTEATLRTWQASALRASM